MGPQVFSDLYWVLDRRNTNMVLKMSTKIMKVPASRLCQKPRYTQFKGLETYLLFPENRRVHPRDYIL